MIDDGVEFPEYRESRNPALFLRVIAVVVIVLVAVGTVFAVSKRSLCFNCLPSRLGNCEYRATLIVSPENFPSSDVVTSVWTSSADSAESTIIDTDITDIPSSSEVRPLPTFDVMSVPSFVWGEVDGDTFFIVSPVVMTK